MSTTASTPTAVKIGIITFIAAGLALLIVGLLTGMPAFAIVGPALAVVGVTVLAAQAKKSNAAATTKNSHE